MWARRERYLSRSASTAASISFSFSASARRSSAATSCRLQRCAAPGPASSAGSAGGAWRWGMTTACRGSGPRLPSTRTCGGNDTSGACGSAACHRLRGGATAPWAPTSARGAGAGGGAAPAAEAAGGVRGLRGGEGKIGELVGPCAGRRAGWLRGHARRGAETDTNGRVDTIPGVEEDDGATNSMSDSDECPAAAPAAAPRPRRIWAPRGRSAPTPSSSVDDDDHTASPRPVAAAAAACSLALQGGRWAGVRCTVTEDGRAPAAAAFLPRRTCAPAALSAGERGRLSTGKADTERGRGPPQPPAAAAAAAEEDGPGTRKSSGSEQGDESAAAARAPSTCTCRGGEKEAALPWRGESARRGSAEG